MVKLLEADFAQLEHINQIIHNNVKYEGYLCFDTALLLEQAPQYGTYNSNNPKNSKITKNVVDVRYDSIIVNVNTKSYTDAYLYTFEVRNILWDGTYYISQSKNTDDETSIPHTDIQITKIDENTISILVSGSNKGNLRVCFHLTQAGTKRTIQENSLIIEQDEKYSDTYNETVKHSGYLKDDQGNPVNGANVSLVGCTKEGLVTTDSFKDYKNIKTNSEGKYTLEYSQVDKPGTYYALITATKGLLEISAIVEVEKTMTDSRGVIWGDESQYKGVYKGRIWEYSITLVSLDKYGKHSTDPALNHDDNIIGQTVTVTMVNQTTGKEIHQTCTIDKNNRIHPTFSYRRFYEDVSQLKISMPDDGVYPAVVYTHDVTHDYCIVDNEDDLRYWATAEDGPDWIMIKPGTIKINSTIPITRDLTLMGIHGENPVILDGQNKTNIFKVTNSTTDKDNFIRFRIFGTKLINATPTIHLNKSTALLVDRCTFTGNSHSKQHHKGCCIYTDITHDNIQHPELFQVHIQNSTFYNNVGNEIVSMGETLINNNLFRTDRADCLMQPEPKVVNVASGNTTYKYNKSHIKVTKSLKTNHSYAKALTFVYKNGRFNGKGPSQLRSNNTLPLYNSPYSNEAYTYAKYYYPYSNVRTTIVCFPKRGHERRATGHASSIQNWVFYDGYDFIRAENGNGNTHDPWTSQELAIPGNQGLYKLESNDFTNNDYNPLMSNYQKIKLNESFYPDIW